MKYPNKRNRLPTLGSQHNTLTGPAQPVVISGVKDAVEAIQPTNRAHSEENSEPMKKILIVGITPPPYYGQAMMTDRLVKARLTGIKLYHVRMAFSRSVSSVGKFQLRKLIHMLEVVGKAFYYRYRYNINALYYMPGGFNFTPVARDIFILFFLRLVFKKIILHFRAAGVSEIVERQPSVLKRLAVYAYRSPDLAIHLSGLNPDDGGYFKAKNTVVIPNGLEDAAQQYYPIQRSPKEYATILYVGVVQETKGVMVLLEAARMLREQQVAIRVNLVGGFSSLDFRETVMSYCRENGLDDIVSFPGVKTDRDKWQYFRDADIFCFPSYYECESFGNVVVEAMMFGLPVVASRWRGIPSIVVDRETGYLVEIKNVQQTAECLLRLIQDEPQRHKMGQAGRLRYEQRYRIETFLHRIEEQLSAHV